MSKSQTKSERDKIEFGKQLVERNFSYSKPSDMEKLRLDIIDKGFKQLAHLINKTCGFSRETSSSMTSLETSMFWAKAAITREEIG